MTSTAFRDRDELRAALDTWLSSHRPPDLDHSPVARFEQLRQWQRTLNEGGWLGFGWPEEFGGRAGVWAEQAAVYAQLALRGAPTPVGIIGLQTVGPALIEHGTRDQHEKYLRRILSADDIWCQGFSEPGAGSDLASLRTVAKKTGDGYVITGQKVWTSWAQYADLCAVLARTGTQDERHRGLSYLVMPITSVGVEVRPIEQLNGESEFNELFLDSVAVPTDAIIGTEGGGWRVALSTLDFERAGYAISRHADLAVAFDDFLADLPAPSSLPLAELGWAAIELETLRAVSASAGEALEAGNIGARSAYYKMVTSQLEQSIAAHMLAMTEYSPIDWATHGDGLAVAQNSYATSRSATIHGGTVQVLGGVIAEHVLGLPRAR
jgi:alkylation response protein AidB-like acyl-CoA dehydrogenase